MVTHLRWLRCRVGERRCRRAGDHKRGFFVLSLNQPATIPGLGTVDDSDLVLFRPSSTGQTTAGVFEWYVAGLDVGLTTAAEDIDAIDLLSDGGLLVSTVGDVSAGDVQGADEDILRFTPTRMGRHTTGSWSFFFDGSDAALDTSSGEDVNGIWMTPEQDRLHFGTVSEFAVDGLSGAGADLFACTPSSLGETTACVLAVLGRSRIRFDQQPRRCVRIGRTRESVDARRQSDNRDRWL